MTNADVDPVRLGLIESLSRPAGNVSGFIGVSAELAGKRLEILKETIPKASRFAIISRPRNPIENQLDPQGLESAFRTAKQNQVAAIMTTAGRRYFAERKRIVELAAKHRLPAIYFQKEFVDSGGLMSYGADFEDLYRRAGGYVDKILRGAKPAELPVQQATKFEFIVNLKAAKQIGLTIPVRVLERANQVIR